MNRVLFHFKAILPFHSETKKNNTKGKFSVFSTIKYIGIFLFLDSRCVISDCNNLKNSFALYFHLVKFFHLFFIQMKSLSIRKYNFMMLIRDRYTLGKALLVNSSRKLCKLKAFSEFLLFSHSSFIKRNFE